MRCIDDPPTTTEPTMNMNTTRFDDKLNGLLIAAVVAIVFGANVDAVRSTLAVPVASATAPVAVVALATPRIR